MKYKKSYALKQFKNELGQANHFLVTILVGLDGVRNGQVTKNDEFDAAWNPQNIKNSAERSRVYAIKSSLAWTVNCLEMYLSLCNKKPKLLTDELSRKFDSAGRSVYKKYEAVVDTFDLDELENACIDLLICWRNKATHYFADNELKKESRSALAKLIPRDEGALRCHLDYSSMLARFDDSKTPTFKEMAFLISKTIAFVEHLDVKILSSADVLTILDNMLCMEWKIDERSFEGIFSKKDEWRKRKLVQYITMLGFSEVDVLDEKEQRYIDKLSTCSYKEARVMVEKGTFITLE